MMTESKNSNGSNPPTVVIADDHEIYRRGLTLFLEHAGMKVLDHAATGRQAVIATIKHQPDILILDIAMPDLDGLIVLTFVKFLIPEVKVVILTALPEMLYFSRASDLGTDGYFSKDVANDKLVDFIQKLASKSEDSNGQATYPNSAPLTLKMQTLIGNKTASGKHLTKDEKSILELISRGFDHQIIADEMEISRDTLNVHLSEIFSKIAVSDRDPTQIKNMFEKFRS